jgi:tetrahydromethanopterin S-methyltransferase subunit F
MNDFDSKAAIQRISEQVENINYRIGGRWSWLGRGILQGFGSIIGAALAILLIGWFLNVIGVIPAFKQQATVWREAVLRVQK